MILAKWGGSFLTNKASGAAAHYRLAPVQRLATSWARALASAGEGGAVVHGAGSFGHPQALAAGVGNRRLAGATLARATSDIQSAVDDLQQRLASTLREAGLAVTVLPARACLRQVRGAHRIDPAPFRRALDDGLHPLTGGDVVPDERLGARILSGDEILHDLAVALRPRMAVFVGDTDGVLDEGKKVVPQLSPLETARAVERLPTSTDATGGMAGKLAWAQRIREAGIDTWLVNGSTGALASLVQGRPALGTHLPPTARRTRPR